MPLYDSPPPCVPDVRRSPSPTGLPLARAIGNEVSRFSCIQFRGVPGVSDYVGPPPGSRVWRRDSVLPSPSDDRVGDLSSWFSKLNTLPVAAPVYASDRISRCATQDSGSGWIRCSFPVGLFHSQLHAGLSRRSVCPTADCRTGSAPLRSRLAEWLGASYPLAARTSRAFFTTGSFSVFFCCPSCADGIGSPLSSYSTSGVASCISVAGTTPVSLIALPPGV